VPASNAAQVCVCRVFLTFHFVDVQYAYFYPYPSIPFNLTPGISQVQPLGSFS
jgi:hypothetical protein